MSRRVFLSLGICLLVGCGKVVGVFNLGSKPVVIKTQYPNLEIESKESDFSDITVLVKKINDNRLHYHIGTYLPIALVKQGSYNYISDERVSKIVTKKLADAFKAAGFKVLNKDSVDQNYDFEVTGEILDYFVTVKGPLAGNSTAARVSLKIKAYDSINNKLVFDSNNIITHALSSDSIKPEIINDAADEVVAKVVKDKAFINELSKWQSLRHTYAYTYTTGDQDQTFSLPIRKRWAVIIGISRYQHAGAKLPNIRYADKDAMAVYQFLLSEQGGKLPVSNIRLLLNEQATYKNIRAALFEFLELPIEEDLVYIYFSGHGAPEPSKRDNLYLLPYDTDPDKIASTAFPMRDVEAALAHHIEAKRVLVFADACHSGGIGGDFGTKGIIVQDNTVNKYLKMLSDVRPGRAIITASEAAEVSREGERWGGGHGVFTYHLLEGLKGKADANGDKIVTLGEAMMYTDEQVRRDTNSEQHPGVSGKIDMNMPLAVSE